MDRQTIYKVMMIAAMICTIMAGVAAIALIVAAAVDRSWAELGSAVLLVCVAAGTGFCTELFSNQTTEKTIFSNDAEKEVLTVKQRRLLRQKRGEVVLRKALIDVENANDNLVHKQLEASHDENVPPHKTDFDRVYPDVNSAGLPKSWRDELE